MDDKEFIAKYEELLTEGYCNCNELNCLDNNAPQRLLSIIKKYDKALENVISDCDEVGVDWFDSIADVDESKPFIENCIDKYGWIEGVKQYYLKKARGDNEL